MPAPAGERASDREVHGAHGSLHECDRRGSHRELTDAETEQARRVGVAGELPQTPTHTFTSVASTVMRIERRTAGWTACRRAR
jgi:hypothetical protein